MAVRKLRESDIPNHRQYAGKVKRLALALTKHGVPFEEAVAFIASAEGITDQQKPALAVWFRDHLPALAGRPDYKEICEDCACCLGGARYAAARAIAAEEPTVEARIRRLLHTPLIVGYRGELVDDNTFLVRFFPAQEYYRCPCLRFEAGQQEFALPAGYCDCCGGHLKHHISKALGCPVEVDCLTSSLRTLGKEGCCFRVRLLRTGAER